MALPDVVVVEFSALCNLKCGFCFGPTDDRSIPDLPTAFWMQALDWLAELGVRTVSVSGGEPVLVRDIVPLLAHAKSLGLSVIVSTHGQARQRVLACVPYIDWIALPIDGLTQAMLREMRGKAWGLDEAATLVGEIRERKPDIHIKIGSVANRVNQHQIADIGVALADRNIPIDTWKVYQYTARRQFKHRWGEYHLSDEAYAEVRREIEARLPKPPFEIVYSSNSVRRMAYVFIYPDGTVAIPNVGQAMEDIVVGNAYSEGRAVLTRVPNVNALNHHDNYNLTYPGTTAT